MNLVTVALHFIEKSRFEVLIAGVREDAGRVSGVQEGRVSSVEGDADTPGTPG